jgi:type I restriction enzyme, S subunit
MNGKTTQSTFPDSVNRSAVIPHGYKRTEVGVIPNHWSTSILGASAFVTKLAGFEYTLYFDYSLSGPVVALRALNIKNGTLDLTDVRTIPRKVSDTLPRSKLAQGDLVISYVGTLGRVAVIPEDNRFHLAPNVAKISVKKETLNPEFLSQYLNSPKGQKSILEASASTTQAALSMSNLRGIIVVNPPLPEQRAIAEALSDIDELIRALDKLIAKKRAIKKAAMQQLFTGKVRLPGFSNVWKVYTIQELIDQYAIIGHLDGNHGELYPRSHEFIESGVPYIAANDLTGHKVSFSNCKYLSEERARRFRKGISRNGDVLFAHNATVGPTGLLSTECDYVILSTTATYFRCNPEKLNNLFFLYVIQSPFFVSQYRAVMAQSTRNQIPITAQRKLSILLPPTIVEQHAIATVLSDMDEEIAVLERRLDKTKQLKQGMMQELLTGRIRLVKPAKTEEKI